LVLLGETVGIEATRIQQVIIKGLVGSEEYSAKVIPYINQTFFKDVAERTLYLDIVSYFSEYKVLPTREAMEISIASKKDISEDICVNTIGLIQKIYNEITSDIDYVWLMAETEKFCRSMAIEEALGKAIEVYQNPNSKIPMGAVIPDIEKAVRLSFDTSLGHEYLEDWVTRHEEYNAVHKRIPFQLEALNEITNGGPKAGNLIVIGAGTGVGKSIFLSDYAAHSMKIGKNALYVSMELEEVDIGQRIDANLFKRFQDYQPENMR
jgi:replicative DNA helicase